MKEEIRKDFDGHIKGIKEAISTCDMRDIVVREYIAGATLERNYTKQHITDDEYIKLDLKFKYLASDAAKKCVTSRRVK